MELCGPHVATSPVMLRSSNAQRFADSLSAVGAEAYLQVKNACIRGSLLCVL